MIINVGEWVDVETGGSSLPIYHSDKIIKGGTE